THWPAGGDKRAVLRRRARCRASRAPRRVGLRSPRRPAERPSPRTPAAASRDAPASAPRSACASGFARPASTVLRALADTGCAAPGRGEEGAELLVTRRARLEEV